MRVLPALLLVLAPLSASAHLAGIPTTAWPTAPDTVGVVVDDQFTFGWTDYDDQATTGTTTIDFFYSAEMPPTWRMGAQPHGLEGTPIVKAIPEKDLANEYTWDTTQVPDYEYILLLRVWDRDQGLQDFQFERYAVLNSRPPDTPTPEATATPFELLPTLPPQTPTILIEQPPTATARPSPTPGGPPTATPTASPSVLSSINLGDWQAAFCNGATIAGVLFAVWGAVWLVRGGARWIWKRQRGRSLLPPR